MSNHNLFATSFHTKRELEEQLRQNPGLYRQYQAFSLQLQKRLDDYLTGKATLPFTYDPFFKKFFSPDVHPDRLSRLLSAILGMKMKAARILPNESSILTPDGSILILDIIVELEDGSLANVEIQKIPFNFPAERLSCYSSDLVMRQYSRVRGERGKQFQYSDLHKVYTVVIYEESPAELKTLTDVYVHHGNLTFDTGLNMELLQEYYLVSLDIFREFHYHKVEVNELKGWLSFLCTRNVSEAEELVDKYPWLGDIYREAAAMSNNLEEVMSMWSESLQILDRNGMQLMIDDMKKENNDLTAKITELVSQVSKLTSQVSELVSQNSELTSQNSALKAALEGKSGTGQV